MRFRQKRIAAAIAAAVTMWACSNAVSATPEPENALRILFVGNSYLYQHDIPGLVEALAAADAGATPIVARTVAVPGYALIDHWNQQTAAITLGASQYQFLVLQQGWTPAGVCRDTLRLAAQLFADQAEPLGTDVAMFEAWAPESRQGQFAGTIGSYRQAAQDVGGVLLPVAEAWQLALEQRVPARLYDDDVHPSAAGSYFAALVVYARLTQRSPVGLPARLTTRSNQGVTIAADIARQLQELAAQVALTPTPPGIPDATPVITTRC